MKSSSQLHFLDAKANLNWETFRIAGEIGNVILQKAMVKPGEMVCRLANLRMETVDLSLWQHFT